MRPQQDKRMKNKLTRALLFYTVLILFFVLLGCKTKQQLPVVIRETTTIENSDFARVKSELNRSKAINDSLKMYIGNIRTAKPECDSVCQDALERQLENFNNLKTSGDNSFGIYYDKYRKILVAHANLKETVSEYRDSISRIKERKSEIKEVPVPAPYPVPAEFSREQKLSLYSGRIFWIIIIVWGVAKLRKIIPV